MTQFPDLPLDVRAELLLNGTWTDASPWLDHGPVTIGRGQPPESTTVSPATLAMTLTNSDARFSQQNPVSPYYPWLVRNTQCRVSIPSDQPYLRLEYDRASYASCPAVSVTTDLDVRADILPTDRSAAIVAGSWQSGGPFGWTLELQAGGWPRLFWSTTGSDQPSARATAALPPGRITLRVTLQLSTGTVTYYTAPGGGADAGPFTQLGAAVVTGATSLHAPAVALCAGGHVGTSAGMYGRVYELEVRSGIGGTVVAHPVFSAQTAGTTSFADGQSNTWTLTGTAELSARDYRAHVEVPEWPQHQPPADPGQPGVARNVLVAAQGGGLLRRLSQRNSSVSSAMRRAWVKTGTALAAYHPLEDSPGAQTLASGIGGPAAQYSGALQLASNSDFTCSAPLPVLGGTVIVGKVPAYSGTWNGNQVSWLMEVPSGGEFNSAEILRVATTGTVAQAVVTYGTGGSMALTLFNAAGSNIGGSAPLTFAANGQPYLCVVSLTPDGSGGVNWALEAVIPGGGGFVGATGNIASASVGAVTSWTLDGGGQLLQTVVGHVAVQAAPSLWDVTAYGAALNAHAGEPAGTRFQRLCGEEAIQCRMMGDPAATTLMGVQSQQTLTQLLQETVDASRGEWFELRQQLGWGFVPLNGLYNQGAAVAVAYSADNLSEWAADPTEDDKDIKNDMTVSQTTGGASARQFAAPGQAINGGRLSTLDPVNGGSGTYDDAQSYNVWLASDLPSIASWIVHHGTVDEPRYPGLVLDLSNRALASIFYKILALDIGQRLTVASPPAHLGPNTVSQLAQQLDEVLWSDQLEITMAVAPSKPYAVAADGASTGRADTDGSALCQAYSSAATSLLAASAGAPWSISGGDVPFDVSISGERVTVTAVGNGATAALTSPGTFAFIAGCNLPAGTWQIGWTVALSGTVAAGDANNFRVYVTDSGGSHGFTSSVNAGSAGTYVQAAVTFTIAAGGGSADIGTNGSTPTTGAVYTATVTSPQLLTVTRSVNGVVKAQASGAPLALWSTPVAAL